MALGEIDGGLRVFDYREQLTLWRTEDDVGDLAWSPDGSKLGVTAGEAGLRVYESGGTLSTERRMGTPTEPVPTKLMYCGENGKPMGRGLTVFYRETRGPVRWSFDGTFVLFSPTPLSQPLGEHDWFIIRVDDPSVHTKLPWARSAFVPGGWRLHINAPNGEQGWFDLDKSKCAVETVGVVDPLAPGLEPFEAPATPHPTSAGWQAKSAWLSTSGEVPMAVHTETGSWIQIHADDSGVAAIDDRGRVWTDEGAEHLVSAWKGANWVDATPLDVAGVRASSDPALWSALP